MSRGTHASQPVPEPVVRNRLVPVYLSPDSALLTALFECDSTGRVLMQEVEELKGKAMETDLSFKDGKLDYKAKAVPDTVYVPLQGFNHLYTATGRGGSEPSYLVAGNMDADRENINFNPGAAAWFERCTKTIKTRLI